ncbi:hypothetical protein FTX61_20330 [Nitriliruptoraceae bacterium ZYF776]|nr:hypothetical protein [Profundirhabdus halotolerans]
MTDTAAVDPTVERRRELLRALGRVERAAGLHRGRLPRSYALHDDRALRRGTDLAAAPELVRAHGPSDGDEPSAYVRMRSRSHVVRFGKFDHRGGGRLRGFLLRDADAVTVKLQTRAEPSRGGVAREVAARREVAEIVPELAPALLAHGIDEAGGVAYLVEPIVVARHPHRRRGVTAAAEAVVDALVPLYRGAGIVGRSITELVDAQTPARWAAAVAALPKLRPLDAAVTALLAEDRRLAVSLVHGDPVASNVLLLPEGRVQLIDWEFARRHAVAHDLGKLLLQAHDRPRVLEVIAARAGALLAADRSFLPLERQLALVQVQMLSWHEHRSHKAAAAGRTRPYTRDLTRRTRLLTELLEA